MTKTAHDVTVPEHAWIVVADGHSARVLANVGQGGVLELREQTTVTPKHLNREGPSGVRPQGDSPRDTDEATFAKQLAHWLNEQAQARAFDALVLAADPTTLGEVRPQLHAEVTKRLVRTLPKTLVHSTPAEIARSVAASN